MKATERRAKPAAKESLPQLAHRPGPGYASNFGRMISWARRALSDLRHFITIMGLLSFLFGGCSKHPGSVQNPQRTAKAAITLQDLEDMFANMRAKTKWDVDGEMLWGYFFTDTDPKKLERVVEPLTNGGYHFVRIYETGDKRTHFLHVERVEKHTPQTLHARNAEFYRLAEKFGLESYDGMDVGPVEKK
jgi:hypothetical protein